MHELSLALDLVDQVSLILTRESAPSAVAVEVWVGDRSGVDAESFRFAFDEAKRGTPLDGARLDLLTGPDRRFVLLSVEVPTSPSTGSMPSQNGINKP